MNNKFNEVYLHMFYEGKTGELPFNLDKFKNFIDTSVKFKGGKIITEDKDLLIDIPTELFNYCYDHQNKIIEFEKIKDLMKNSKHYSNIKNINGINLYFTIFDFTNNNEISSFIFKSFNILPENNEEFKLAYNYFNTICKDLDGFFNYYEDKALCVINEKGTNVISTIYHELSHFIQTICNIRITKNFEFDNNKIKYVQTSDRFKRLEQLNITYDQLNYYFSSNEFLPHIDDLIIGLWKTYLKFYKERFPDILSFIYHIIDNIKDKGNFRDSKLCFNYSLANGNNIAPIIMFAASYYFNHKYQFIFRKVNNILIQKFHEWKKENNI